MNPHPDDFIIQSQKSITLLGMSGLGKTTLSNVLKQEGWFHYSVDYRIGSEYLSSYINQNILSIDNISGISDFIGQVGAQDKGGLSLQTFKERQALYNKAEISAMYDVLNFLSATDKHFINDTSGSFCELEDPALFKRLSDLTLFVYIRADERHEEELLARAKQYPKPLYYPPALFEKLLAIYMDENHLKSAQDINPDEFSVWIFPKIFASRIPKYEALATEYGCTINADDLESVKNAQDFLDLVSQALHK